MNPSSVGQLEAMSHDILGMVLVEDPSKRLGEIISRIDSTGNVEQFNVTPCFPILDSEESNVNMPGSLSRFPRVENGDSRFVIFID